MPRVPALHRALLTAVVPLTLAACGGDDSSGGSDRASQPPKELHRSMTDELAKVRSYHLDGTQSDENGASRISGDIKADGSANIQLTLGEEKAAVILTGGQAYIRGNAPFWSKRGGSAGPRLARIVSGRWVKTPSSDGLGLDELSPKNLAHCAAREAATVTEGGTRDFAGQKVVVLRDKGSPGNSPTDVYVQADGRPLPVRVLQTGPQPPGGKPDPRCDDGTPTTASDVRLSRFDQPVEIKAPANALDPAQIAASAGQSS